MRRSMIRWPAVLLAILAVVLFALAPMPVGALDRRTGDRVVIGADETIADDLIVTGSAVVINGRVIGDVVAMGQTVEINGTVEGDVFAVGGGVIIAGTVTDDVRTAAAGIQIGPSARIGDDLMAVGSSLETLAGSDIGGTLAFGGAQALVAGNIKEDLLFGGDGLALSGAVGGNADLSVGAPGTPGWASQMRFEGAPPAPPVASGLSIDPEARISGNLAYSSPATSIIPEGVVKGQVRFTEEVATDQPIQPSPYAWLFEQLRRFAALLLVGLLIVWLAPRFSRDVTSELEAKPLASLGWGLLTLLGLAVAFLLVPLATIFLAVVLGMVSLNGLMGIVIAIGVLMLLALIVLAIIAMAYVAQIAVSYELGKLILARLRPAWNERPFAPLVIGLALLVVLTALPTVGWLFGLAAVLLGLGALWLFGRDTMQHRPIPAPVEVRR